ncbi:hypothetical protein EV671_103250, partial [Roseateles saccharophilus]
MAPARTCRRCASRHAEHEPASCLKAPVPPGGQELFFEQQSVLSLHRVRQAFVKARTAQANQIRGLLGEYGLVVPQGIAYIAQRVPALIEDAENELPGSFRLLIQRLLEHLKVLQQQVDEIECYVPRRFRLAIPSYSRLSQGCCLAKNWTGLA